jgi:hypothetical protein
LCYKEGEYISPNEKCTSAVADALFAAEDEQKLTLLYRQILDWYYTEFVWGE